MNIETLKMKLAKLETLPLIKRVIIDDYNSKEAYIFIDIDENCSKISAAAQIKRFFKNSFDYKLYLSFDKEYDSYNFDFPYAYYEVSKPTQTPKSTLVYSRKAYHEDKEWAESVEETQSIANSREHHIELLEKMYPDYIIEPYYTYEHTGMHLERNPSCRWDSSADAMVAYKDEKDMLNKIEEINENLF